MALSRNEEILQRKISGETYDKVPLSRIEALLIDLNTSGGGSGGDWSPMNDLTDEEINDLFNDDSVEPSGDDLSENDIDDIFSMISTNND